MVIMKKGKKDENIIRTGILRHMKNLINNINRTKPIFKVNFKNKKMFIIYCFSFALIDVSPESFFINGFHL